MQNNKLIAQILLPLAFDEAFSYYIPENMDVKIGDVVLVNFVKRNIYGVVLEVKTEKEKSKFKIKNILEKHDNIKISPNLIKLIEFSANYNLYPKGLFLKLSISILNSIKTKKIGQITDNIDIKNFNLKKLAKNQEDAAKFFKEKIDKNKYNVTLLDGVTGSGKTEVYFEAIAKILKQNSGQVLIMLPEIILTDQLIKRFEDSFDFKPEIWHSKIGNARKRDIFYSINNGNIKVLIGTRSALFLPFKNLKLIIIDEEHESSFKQEDIVNYHGRDMAIARAKLENISVILSSATPSVETFTNVKNGKYYHQILTNKFFNNQKADIKLVDMKKENLAKNHFISKSLEYEINKSLENNEQILLFLNRRGYAPITLCKSCGFKISCKNCSAYATYHQKINKLICHHCGHSAEFGVDCTNCSEENSLITLGAGVEKIADEAKKLFPNQKIGLMTSDTLNNIEETSQTIDQIINNEINIIIGTQIIAKGHHFPHLSLVGIIDGDGSFNNSNLRAAEKSFQLLTQIIGRAGREKHKAKIVLQSYNINNLVFKYITTQDRDSFLNLEIKNREIVGMPPFGKMIALIFISKNEDMAINEAKKILRKFPIQDNIEIFGPAPMPISKIRNSYYYRLLIKSDKKLNIQKLIKKIIQSSKTPNQVRIKIDVDPI